MGDKTSPAENLSAVFEALLFTYGEPLSVSKLAKLAMCDEKKAQGALKELGDSWRDRGLVILEKDGEYQMGTNPKYADYAESLVKNDMHEELSRAALETLSIVAYKGPLTRAEVEYIRGINSSFTMRNLLLRGLIERTENPKDARSPQYRVSFDCLKYLGIKKIQELPEYKDLETKVASIHDEIIEKNNS